MQKCNQNDVITKSPGRTRRRHKRPGVLLCCSDLHFVGLSASISVSSKKHFYWATSLFFSSCRTVTGWSWFHVSKQCCSTAFRVCLFLEGFCSLFCSFPPWSVAPCGDPSLPALVKSDVCGHKCTKLLIWPLPVFLRSFPFYGLGVFCFASTLRTPFTTCCGFTETQNATLGIDCRPCTKLNLWRNDKRIIHTLKKQLLSQLSDFLWPVKEGICIY